MNQFTRRTAPALAAVLLLTPALAACGDDGDEETRTTHTMATTTTADATEALSPEGVEALEQVEERGEPTLEATGPVDELQITDDVVGDGPEVTPEDTVSVHYVGAAATTGEVFESSWDTGQLATFPLSGVIEGWSEGLVGMQPGGRRTLVIPAEMAYGDSGPAPGDSLVFTVDLIEIAGTPEEAGTADDIAPAGE